MKSTPLPGRSVRGSRSGHPTMAVLDLLGRRWALRILWALREETMTFRDIQEACDSMSPSVLNQRLTELREAGIVDHCDGGYGLTDLGDDLTEALVPISRWSRRWARRVPA